MDFGSLRDENIERIPIMFKPILLIHKKTMAGGFIIFLTLYVKVLIH